MKILNLIKTKFKKDKSINLSNDMDVDEIASFIEYSIVEEVNRFDYSFFYSKEKEDKKLNPDFYDELKIAEYFSKKQFFINEERFIYSKKIKDLFERLLNFYDDYLNSVNKETSIKKITEIIKEKYFIELDYSSINKMHSKNIELNKKCKEKTEEIIKINEKEMPIEQKKETLKIKIEEFSKIMLEAYHHKIDIIDKLRKIALYDIKIYLNENIENARIGNLKNLKQEKYKGLIDINVVKPNYKPPLNNKESIIFIKNYLKSNKQLKDKMIKDLIQDEVMFNASQILNLPFPEEFKILLNLIEKEGSEYEFVKTVFKLSEKVEGLFLINLDDNELAKKAFDEEKNNDNNKVILANTAEEFAKNLLHHGGFGVVYHSIPIGEKLYATGTINRKTMKSSYIDNHKFSLVDPTVNKARSSSNDDFGNQRNHLFVVFEGSVAGLILSGNHIHARINQYNNYFKENITKSFIEKQLLKKRYTEKIGSDNNTKIKKNIIKNIRIVEIPKKYEGTFMVVLKNKSEAQEIVKSLSGLIN